MVACWSIPSPSAASNATKCFMVTFLSHIADFSWTPAGLQALGSVPMNKIGKAPAYGKKVFCLFGSTGV
jgi:hypothetical protein